MELARATNTNRKSGEPYFREAGLRFLRSLRRNNRREWFEAHKPEFERELKQPMLALIETVNRRHGRLRSRACAAAAKMHDAHLSRHTIFF